MMTRYLKRKLTLGNYLSCVNGNRYIGRWS